MRFCYTDCVSRTWEPNMDAGNDWISIDSIFISWHKLAQRPTFNHFAGLLEDTGRDDILNKQENTST